jgi:hypothetical protein
MPVQALAAREQKNDRRRCSMGAVYYPSVAERLAEMSALQMRLAIKELDDVLGG